MKKHYIPILYLCLLCACSNSGNSPSGSGVQIAPGSIQTTTVTTTSSPETNIEINDPVEEESKETTSSSFGMLVPETRFTMLKKRQAYDYEIKQTNNIVKTYEDVVVTTTTTSTSVVEPDTTTSVNTSSSADTTTSISSTTVTTTTTPVITERVETGQIVYPAYAETVLSIDDEYSSARFVLDEFVSAVYLNNQMPYYLVEQEDSIFDLTKIYFNSIVRVASPLTDNPYEICIVELVNDVNLSKQKTYLAKTFANYIKAVKVHYGFTPTATPSTDTIYDNAAADPTLCTDADSLQAIKNNALYATSYSINNYYIYCIGGSYYGNNNIAIMNTIIEALSEIYE